MRLSESELRQLREMFSPDGRELRLVLPMSDATDQMLQAMQNNDALMAQAQNFAQAQQAQQDFANNAANAGDNNAANAAANDAGDAAAGDDGGNGGDDSESPALANDALNADRAVWVLKTITAATCSSY
jgi:hypothetical protein